MPSGYPRARACNDSHEPSSIVPFGTALRFSHRWDGLDLLEVLTRGVVLDAMG
jgi:hypothetical protein